MTRSRFILLFANIVVLQTTLCFAWTDNTFLSGGSSSSSCFTRRHWGQGIASSTLSSLLWMPNAAGAGAVDERPKPTLAEEAFLSGSTAPEAGRVYFPALTPPFWNRATYRYNLGRNAWAFEQLLTFANVTATIRCTVLQLESTGGLWVHSPQYPTGEFLKLLEELGRPVEHVILPCNALEHKAPIQPFLRKFPNAKVWISPGQYGPFGSCGQNRGGGPQQQVVPMMGYLVDGILGSDVPSWADEFDIATLYVNIPQNAGPVSEVAFCHRPTQTLVVTDAVVYIPPSPSDIYTTYFDRTTVVDDPTFWPRTVLQAVFLPLRTDTANGSYYPGFAALQGRLVRAPILRAFADARAPESVRQWIAEIANYKFDRIVSSHFASPINATPGDVQAAFAYLAAESTADTTTAAGGRQADVLPPIACQDWELLEGLNRIIADNKLGAPAVYDYKRDCL